MAEMYRCLVGGEWVDAKSGRTFEVINPANRQVLANVARGDAADVDAAVQSARVAFRAWRHGEPAQRGRILLEVARRILAEKDRLARLEAQDTGKPLAQALADCNVAARYFEFFAGIADKIGGTTIPINDNFLDYTRREPLGVVAQILPWNYPLQMSARGVAPALAAGNVVVVKPAEEACLTALELARICLEAGVPAGVLNIVPGLGEEAGAAIAAHPDVNLVAFTGSVETGGLVMQAAARGVKPVLLELGGKSPNIVFPDADLDKALPVIQRAAYQNAGQTCSAGSRVLVHSRVHDEVVQRLADASRKVRLGEGLKDPDMGPVISERQWNRVLQYMTVAREEGAAIAAGGRAPTTGELSAGFFIEPTILDRVDRRMRVHREEIFGPVIAVTRFDELEEAADIANDTPYGLVAGIWTRDLRTAHWLAHEIEAGQIYVNTYGAGGGVELPFGGYKKSGFGREKGLEAINFYTQVKNVCVSLAK